MEQKGFTKTIFSGKSGIIHCLTCNKTGLTVTEKYSFGECLDTKFLRMREELMEQLQSIEMMLLLE